MFLLLTNNYDSLLFIEKDNYIRQYVAVFIFAIPGEQLLQRRYEEHTIPIRYCRCDLVQRADYVRLYSNVKRSGPHYVLFSRTKLPVKHLLYYIDHIGEHSFNSEDYNMWRCIIRLGKMWSGAKQSCADGAVLTVNCLHFIYETKRYMMIDR